MKNDMNLLKGSLDLVIKNESITSEILESAYYILESDSVRIKIEDEKKETNRIDQTLDERSNLISKSMGLKDEAMSFPATCIESIAEYFIQHCTDDMFSLYREIEKLSVKKYIHLHKYDYFSLVYGVFRPENVEESILHRMRQLKIILFYTVVDIIYKKLGLMDTFEMFEAFVRAFYNGYFNDEDRSFVEILIEASNYCKNNSEYPIEWLLDAAFISRTEIGKDPL